MRRMLVIESGTRGLLAVNGCFCGPLEGDGQAFPCAESAQVYIQLFPFEPGAAALTAALELREGRVARLEPTTCCYMLLWPDGVMQLELRMPGQADEAGDADAGDAGSGEDDLLTAYLRMRLAGDPRAAGLLAGPGAVAGLGAYEAVVPLRFAPLGAPKGYALRAGIVRRLADNVARVDAVLARAGRDGHLAGLAVVPGGDPRAKIGRLD